MRGQNWRGLTNPGRRRRHAIWQAIEREYDEPVRDVLAVLRQQGCSWPTVAGVLGVTCQTVRNWRRVLQLPIGDGRIDDLREDRP